MSKTIDERVVEMRFDNSQFEKNVSTSMSTLQKLKQSLNLKDASKGLDNISNAAKKFDLSPMGNGVETVKAKFSALEVMAVTALANITNSAVNAGKRLATAFTIEPIKMGFQEYETQINAVQTILSNTRSKGTTLDQVNAALDELNTYADKTIYNFTEMTRNIGTFTAAGVDLDTSVSAIKGIANLAAVSGSNSQQASTAMYQLSQALAAGTVKLMDWNSVVNAGMGGQVFQDALKETARVHGIAIDQMIEDNGSFRETLQEGWLSSEILTETLAKFTGDLTEAQILSMGYTQEQAKEIMALGQDANDAATKVKTFTQLMDTLKEAAQSGWTQSWEIIIGDYEEAKALWTGVSDAMGEMINRSAEARNAVLEGWAQAGGRSMAIEAIKNAFEALVSVIKPIKEAFREIFPPTTAAQLVNITKAVRDFTEKLKLNKTQSENLKATFKGLFAVVDILWTVFKELVGGAVKLVGAFTGMGSGILGVTGSLGDMLVNLRNTVKESNLFGKAIDFIVRVVQNGVGKVKEFVGYIKGKFDAPGFEHLFDILSKIGEVCGTVVREVTKFTSDIAKTIGNAFSADNIDTAMGLVNGGIFASILLGIKKFIGEMNSTFKGGGFINSLKETLGGLKDTLEDYQKSLQANTLMKIAGAIGILAASLFLLSTIDPDRLGSAIVGMTALFGELVGSIALLDKIDVGFKKTGKTIAMMIGISTAILILAVALKKLSGISTGDMIKSVLGIAALSAIVVKSAEAMSKDGPKVIKGATGLILFAAAIKILASACKDIAALSWEEMAKGLTGVGVLMAAVSIFMNKTEFGPKTIANAASVVVLSVALKIMASACKDLGSMNIADLAKGLGSIALLLGGIYLFIDKVGDTKMLISTGVALVLLGAAMKTFASAIQSMGSMSWNELVKGLVGFAGALGAVTLALNLMPEENMIKIGTGLAIVSVSLVILASAMQKLGSMSWGELAKSLIVLTVALAELSIALILMEGTLSGSAALFVAAAALNLLTPALKSLGEMSLWEIIKSLAALAGALVIFAVAAAVLTPVVPVMIALGASMALLGLGIAGIGVGIMALSAGFTALAAAGVAGATSVVSSLTIIIVGIANLIPTILKKIGEGIVAFCQVIAEGAKSIGEMVLTVGSTVLNTLTQLIPQFVQFVVTLVDEFLKTVAEKAPSIIQSGIDILVAFISGISNNIDKVVSAATDLIINFMNTIANKAMEIAQAGADIAINLINGMAEGIRNNAQAAHDAISNLCSAILEAVLIFFGIHSPSTVFAEIGGNLIQGLINGIGGFSSSAVNTVKTLAGNLVDSVGTKAATFSAKGRELMSNLRNGISNKLGDVRNSVNKVVSTAVKTVGSKASQFTAKGKELMSKLKSGVSSGASAVKTGVTKVAKDMLSALKNKVSEFKTIGSNMIKGLKQGIENAAKGAVNAAKGVAKSAIEGAKKLLKINSPSKVFLSMGKSIDEGFVMGIEADASKVRDASVTMSKDAINGAKKAVSAVGKVIANGVNSNPSISPVVDMDSIKTTGLNIGANVSAFMSKPISSVAQIIDKAQAEINESNNRVIEAVNGLRDDMNRFYTENDQEIALYVDSRKLATSIAKPMNRELNILSKRGAY